MDQRKHAAWLTAARYCPPINANFRAVGSEANPGIFFRDGCCVGRARPTQEKKHRPSHHPRPDIIQEKILKVIILLRIGYPQSCSCRRGTESAPVRWWAVPLFSNSAARLVKLDKKGVLYGRVMFYVPKDIIHEALWYIITSHFITIENRYKYFNSFYWRRFLF